jgi:hypothetical protein
VHLKLDCDAGQRNNGQRASTPTDNSAYSIPACSRSCWREGIGARRRQLMDLLGDDIGMAGAAGV